MATSEITTAPRHRLLRLRLFIMMFLQFAIWGAWYSVLSDYLAGQGFTGTQTSWIYALLPLACMIGPFVGGQIADRWVPTQIFLAVAHVLGGIAMLLAAPRTDFGGVFVFMLIWSLFYGPTLGLTNSIAFHHLPNGEKDFGPIRLGGTLGWIAVGWALTCWLSVQNPSGLPDLLAWVSSLLAKVWEWRGLDPTTAPHVPNVLAAVSTWIGSTVGSVTGKDPNPHYSDCLRFGGWISLVMGVFCLALPHTPPAKSGGKPWAFVEAFKLLRDRRFAIFMAVAFVVSTEFLFYFQLTGPFLTSPEVGIKSENLAMTMTLAQIAEIITICLVGWFLPKLGIKWSLAIGILAWPVRYLVFAIGAPWWLMVAVLPLHGICFVCFFVVAFIYVDKIAPPDIKASAQSMLIFVLYGAGMFLGAYIAGAVQDWFTVDGIINWRGVFLVPTVITVVCGVVFFAAFEEPPADESATA